MHICYHFYTVHYTVYHSKKTKKCRCAQLHAVDEWCLLSVWRGDRSEEAKTPHLKSAVPPILAKQESLLWARVYVSLQVFPPTALHPILLNKGTWGSGLKWEWAHEWRGTNWHVAFCEVSAQPLDRWLPFANEHSCLCVSLCFPLPVSLQRAPFSSPALCSSRVADGP